MPEKCCEFQKATAENPAMEALQDVVLDGWSGKKAGIVLSF